MSNVHEKKKEGKTLQDLPVELQAQVLVRILPQLPTGTVVQILNTRHEVVRR